MLLPDKPYFTLIERHVPPPGETCQMIASSLEKAEEATIHKEIAKRRMRLGANLDQVTRDVKREVLLNSEVVSLRKNNLTEIENIYQKIIDWTEDIDIRRKYESKLLRHAYDSLIVCPPSEKRSKRDKVWQIAHGMVVLNLPDELAWTISMDWKDFEYIGIRQIYTNV